MVAQLARMQGTRVCRVHGAGYVQRLPRHVPASQEILESREVLLVHCAGRRRPTRSHIAGRQGARKELFRAPPRLSMLHVVHRTLLAIQ